MTPSTSGELAELLARAGWVRALAARLVEDRDAADDLAQDAYVAALSGPGGVRSPAGWLAGVARNLARRGRRGAARRRAREHDAARPEETAETSELVERAELQARVIQAVTALAEPYRTTVLLRFFEGLTLVEVGERTGVPASTARTRLARALAELRERLDREHGGERAVWCAALARLAGPELHAVAGAGAGAGVLAGVLAMNAWMKGAAAAALVVAGLAGWRALGSADRTAQSAAARDAAPGRAELAEAQAPRAALAEVPAGASLGRAEVAAPEKAPRESAAAAPPPAPAFAPARLEARLVDEHGRGIAGGELRARQEELKRFAFSFEAAARASAGGGVALEVPLEAPWSSAVTVASAPGYATSYARTRLESGAVTHLGELVLGPGCVLAGSVADAAGVAIAEALVFVEGVESERTDPEELRRLGPLPDSLRPLHHTTTDAAGRFSLPGTAAGPARLWAHAEGYAYTSTEPLEVLPGGNPPVEVVLHPLAADDVIQGIVLSPDGAPVPYASLDIQFAQGNSQTSTGAAAGADGRFSLTVTARVPHTLIIQDQKNRWASVPLPGVEPGGPELVVRFHATPSLRFDVVDAAGVPVELFELTLMDERGYAPGSFDRLGGVAQGEHAGGTVALPAPNVGFRVEVAAPGFERASLGPFPAGAELPTTRVELVALPGVSGRVLAAGEPVSGAALYLDLVRGDDSLHVKNGLRCRYSSSASRPAGRTDDEGRFRVFPASAGLHVLRAEGDGHAPTELELDLDPALRVEGLELALGAGGAIEGRVLVPAGEEAEGRILALNHGDGRGRTLRTGPEGRYRAEGLVAGAWQVLPFDEEILPNRSQSYMGPNEDRKPIEWSCKVFEGRTTTFDVDLRERAGGRLVGRLELGVAAEGWTAALTRVQALGPHENDVALDALDAGGSFELQFPEPGTYRLLVLSPPGAARLELSLLLDLGPGETAWEWKLALGSLAGRIESPAASAVHQYRFTGSPPAGDGPAPEISARFEPAADGAFRLPFVPAGQGVLESVGSASTEVLRQVSVKAGQELVIELP